MYSSNEKFEFQYSIEYLFTQIPPNIELIFYKISTESVIEANAFDNLILYLK